MNFIQKFIIFVFTLILISCKPADNPKKDFLQWVQKGKIIDKVICKDDQSLSYCLYLPSNYNIKQNWPIIYCFDPKADGKLPVTLFKDIAEKKGYIIVGSNDSKNGTSADYLSHITDVLFSDTRLKLSIDESRIYVTGFSGGARVACASALTYGNIAGVIACSAGFQPNQGQPQFEFIGIAGDSDMNYLEMKILDSTLGNYSLPHQFYVFSGKHHWPPKLYLENAIESFELIAMKNNPLLRNDSVIKAYIKKNLINSDLPANSNNTDSLIINYRQLNNSISVLQGLADISKLNESLTKLLKNENLVYYLRSEKIIETEENLKRQLYINSYQKEDIRWWTNEINILKITIKSGKNKTEGLSCSRLLAYISLISYSYINSALSQQNWKAAENFLQIYGMADPENPDYFYFSACYLANTGNLLKASEVLKKAISHGFSDIAKIENDPLISPLRNTLDIQKIISK